MSTATVRSGFDTWAGSAKPSLEHPRETSLYVRSGAGEAFLWFKVPAPRGAVVTSATLTLRAKGASSGSRTLTAQRVTANWSESRLNWNNKPASTSSGAATKSVSTLADGDAIDLDVTTIVQAWANGTANYGFRITTSTSTVHKLHALNSTVKPTLTVTWSDAPSKPTNLRPSEAATGIAKPHLVFDYLDLSGDTSLAAIEVQIDDAADFVGAWSSGEVAATSAGLDLAATAYAGLTAGVSRYWRVRAKDGAGLWSVWSDPVTMVYTPKPALTITNMGGGVATEPTPPILWSMAGQVRYQVLVREAATAKTVHDSKERTGSATSYTIPEGVLQDGTEYVVEVRGWDAVVREATPGDDTYTKAEAHFSLATDVATSTVATLTAAPVDLTPWVTLTWTRATTPDAFAVYRDGVLIRTLDPADVFVSGTTYAWVYYGARPNRAHTYSVRAVVNGKTSPDGPTASLTTSPSGLWVVDFDRGVDLTLWGDEEGTWTMQDDASVYTPVGSTEVVRIVSGMRGLEGSISGRLMEGFGKTFEQQEASLYEIKSRPTKTVRIIAGDENFTALIGNVRISPKPDTRQGRIVKGVSFDFWQVGKLPFDLVT